jgi:DNA-binding response OmpR family regulator
VILDVMLPAKDGFAVCRSVRAGGSSVPILMLTARDVRRFAHRRTRLRRRRLLVKPFDFGELLARCAR